MGIFSGAAAQFASSGLFLTATGGAGMAMSAFIAADTARNLFESKGESDTRSFARGSTQYAPMPIGSVLDNLDGVLDNLSEDNDSPRSPQRKEISDNATRRQGMSKIAMAGAVFALSALVTWRGMAMVNASILKF